MADTVGSVQHLGQVLAKAASSDTSLAARLASAGIEAQNVSDRDGLAALPVLSKDELVGLAPAQHSPGDAIASRIFQSPGPIYEAQPPGSDPWRWAPALTAIGLAPGDRVINCFGYHLSPAGAMFDEAVIAAGATVVPAGIGNQIAQVQAITDLGVRGYVGLPSYLKALIDVHADNGGTREDFGVEYALVTAEPLPDSLRAELLEWVPVVRMAYGTAEVGLIACEDGSGPGLRVDEEVIVEVCEIGTGVPITEGEGEVVVTVLRDVAPVVRFGTGDLSAWAEYPSRLQGVLGRVGQATKVRGMFVHPRQAEAVLRSEDSIVGGRFVITRAQNRDHLRCEIVVGQKADASSDRLVQRVDDTIRNLIRVRAEVVLVEGIPSESPVLVDERSW
ncbi:phenylacetate--CoA ligase family protein [Brevibacterium sp. ZH18]|uniref:phenylacetate--CoA ligase family protein n=1 Tax=Brevibacterium sp. ZH18 TaxID=2927784 RepID=UPI001F61AA12|nr:phenylacetate--CoA ligase family protein [Brevibacterium sp. ZH18]MCI4012910.1 phenylacetate--CoA ligase family protein [Brevibacterium sp. ZH18]